MTAQPAEWDRMPWHARHRWMQAHGQPIATAATPTQAPASAQAPSGGWSDAVPEDVRAAIVRAVSAAAAAAYRDGARAVVESGRAYAEAAAALQPPRRFRGGEDRWATVSLAAELASQGIPQRVIAKRLGIGQSTVCKLLAEHRRVTS